LCALLSKQRDHYGALKDFASGPQGFFPFVRAILSGLGCWGATEQLWNAFHNARRKVNRKSLGQLSISVSS
jgi:hypothetical protein